MRSQKAQLDFLIIMVDNMTMVDIIYLFIFMGVRYIIFLSTIFFFLPNNCFSTDLSSIKTMLNSSYFNDIQVTSILQARTSILNKISNYEELLKACQESKL